MKKVFGKTLCDRCKVKQAIMTVAVQNVNESYPKLHNFCSDECKEQWKKSTGETV